MTPTEKKHLGRMRYHLARARWHQERVGIAVDDDRLERILRKCCEVIDSFNASRIIVTNKMLAAFCEIHYPTFKSGRYRSLLKARGYTTIPGRRGGWHRVKNVF